MVIMTLSRPKCNLFLLKCFPSPKKWMENNLLYLHFVHDIVERRVEKETVWPTNNLPFFYLIWWIFSWMKSDEENNNSFEIVFCVCVWQVWRFSRVSWFILCQMCCKLLSFSSFLLFVSKRTICMIDRVKVWSKHANVHVRFILFVQ